MTGRIIDAAVANLEHLGGMVRSIDTPTYANAAIAPYYSGIGSHLRHILDIFACVLRGLPERTIDFTDRCRDTPEERDPELGLAYLNRIVVELEDLREVAASLPVTVIDDLGQGEVPVAFTLGAALVQAHSHAIHHYACIGYLLSLQGVSLPDERFGLNPTTPLATLD